MARVATSTVAGADEVERLVHARRQPVPERLAAPGRFEADGGPTRAYVRTVEVEQLGDGRARVAQRVEFRLAAPYFGWLFGLFFRRALKRPDSGRPPWWAPPEQLDARAATVLGTLSAVAIIFGYLNTLFSQTVAFAADEFHASNSAQGAAGAAVRFGALLSLVLIAAADRRGRRSILLLCTAAGCVLSATGALAPSLAWLAASQTVARAFSAALLVVALILAAEEMPAGARAYAISLLALFSGLGAGICVLSLRLADIGTRGWRLLFVLPLLGVLVVRGLARNLPESRRYAAAHAEAPVAGHGRRLWLLAVSGFLYNLFVAPDSQFVNRFLRHERHYSGGAIGILSVGVGTPGAVGVAIGGKLADQRGRRVLAAFSVSVGTALGVVFYFASGVGLWIWGFLATIVSDAAVPALFVFGPELFPTSLRGRANGVINVVSLVGSAVGLAVAGALADQFGRVGPAMAVLAVGPVLLGVLLLVAYPETAGRELEELNPEDA